MNQTEQLAPETPAENLNREVLERFTGMLANVDFESQLKTLGIGRFQFTRKKLALGELRAMYVGLWKLALNRSFPDDAVELFERFLDPGEVKSKGKRKQAEAFRELCYEYAKILEVEGDTNFINVAILLCQHLGRTGQEDLRPISLQLALDMRAMYHNIFEHLI